MLFSEQMIRLHRDRDSLPVSNSRLPGIYAHAVTTFQTFEENFKVQFTHPGNDRLAGFRMSESPKCRILIAQNCQRDREPSPVPTEQRFERHADDWFRKH